jgi:hypothetical protein
MASSEEQLAQEALEYVDAAFKVVQPQQQADQEAMQRALVNEKHAPELLPYESQLVNRIRRAIQAAAPAAVKAGPDEWTALRLNLYLMDVERQKYRVAEYLRVRLAKVERRGASAVAGQLPRPEPAEQRARRGRHDPLPRRLRVRGGQGAAGSGRARARRGPGERGRDYRAAV